MRNDYLGVSEDFGGQPLSGGPMSAENMSDLASLLMSITGVVDTVKGKDKKRNEVQVTGLPQNGEDGGGQNLTFYMPEYHQDQPASQSEGKLGSLGSLAQSAAKLYKAF
jgi:hypothetical protein|tara:strand:+ start:554 stop:880 length:327 start_codon:yes stop_codon:yes gene_type:complete